MPVVVALESFDHYGKRSRGDSFRVDERHAKKLVRAGLVAMKGSKEDPRMPSGEKLSASPAGQALPQTTAKKSKRGGRRKKVEASSSPTPPSD